MTTESAQTKKQSGNVGKVAMRVERLRSVQQTMGSFAVLGDPGEPPYSATFARPRFAHEQRSENVLVVIAEFEFRGGRVVGEELSEKVEIVTEPAEIDAFVRVNAAFVVEYVLSAGGPLADEDLRAFADLNTMLNVYPFWREFIYNSLGRANLPQILIPPFNPMRPPTPRPSTQPTPATAKPSE